MKQIKSCMVGISMVLLVGCVTANGSALVVGSTRTAITDWESVAISDAMPEDATRVALVSASSNSGWSKQLSADYAVNEIKKQAAKVGANLIVIESAKTETDSFGIQSYLGVSSEGLTVPVEKRVLAGVAVYVERDVYRGI